MAITNSSLVFNGLGTFSNVFTFPAAGPYYVQGQITLPTLVGGAGASAVVVVVKQNSSTVYTGNAGATGFGTLINAAAGDTVSLVLSSSNAADQGLNVIKTSMQVFQQI